MTMTKELPHDAVVLFSSSFIRSTCTNLFAVLIHLDFDLFLLHLDLAIVLSPADGHQLPDLLDSSSTLSCNTTYAADDGSSNTTDGSYCTSYYGAGKLRGSLKDAALACCGRSFTLSEIVWIEAGVYG